LIVEANSVIEGEYSGDEGWDIVNKIIEAICDTLIDKYDDLPEALEPYENPCATEETYVRYFERFTRTLKRCMDKEEIPKTHLVVKMDEFGRFFEKRDTSIFMQLWKSVMEMEAFDAILAGHDVITQMIRKYVNPFGTINLFQISYINRAAAVSLITQPTYREDKGSSSFTDEAVDYIWKQSGGNVFYIHVICGYAVKFMNNYHINILNTKYVQQAIAEQLDHIDVCALEELGHALYKSGECGEDRVTDTEAKIVLHAITVCQNTHDCSTAEALMAYVADAYNLYIPNNERVMSILESLFSRGVIEKDDKGNYMIRVNFYPSYLDKHIIASLEKIQ
ncbi:MAG: hypothetical protein PUB07_00210, partial [Clostridia bacterium]|nr:hypothetical protein [Clostridia bacterium]